MDNTGIVPTMNVGDGGFGGSCFVWIFGLLILMGMFNGGWGNNNSATSGEVQRGFDAQNSASNQREILTAVSDGAAQSVAATNSAYHDAVMALSDKYSELQRDIGNLAVGQANTMGNMDSCCCNVRMEIANQSAGINAGIAQNRYEAAMNTAAINANTTAQTQKILDAMAQNKIETLQAQVNDLNLRTQLAGVVRYPMNTMYGVPSPCFCGNM